MLVAFCLVGFIRESTGAGVLADHPVLSTSFSWVSAWKKEQGSWENGVSLFPERLGEGRFLGAVSLSSMTSLA